MAVDCGNDGRGEIPIPARYVVVPLPGVSDVIIVVPFRDIVVNVGGGLDIRPLLWLSV